MLNIYELAALVVFSLSREFAGWARAWLQALCWHAVLCRAVPWQRVLLVVGRAKGQRRGGSGRKVTGSGASDGVEARSSAG